MTRNLRLVTVTTALAVSAGTAFGQSAARQHDEMRKQDDMQLKAQASGQGMVDLYKGKTLIGKDVVNPNNEEVAEIQDFVIDRGSGRIEHALLKSGAVLGIGGKTIAVPYSRLTFDAANERFQLDMTAEQIDRAVAFVPENWSELNTTTWADKLDQWWYGEDDTNPDADLAAFKDGDRETIEGTIRSVDRARGAGRGENVTVVVETDDGKTETLTLGPSWFVMGDAAAPMRGDKIKAEIVRPRGDTAAQRSVVWAEIDGDRLELRDNEGHPRWRVAQTNGTMREADRDRADRDPDHANRDDADRDRMDHGDRNDPHGGTAVAGRQGGRLMLLSDLVGAAAITADKTGGEVQDVVIERYSGRIALIGFDPNENFLGMADEIKAVPWQVVRIGADRKVRIDAGSAALQAAEKLADDVSTYETAGRLDPLYTNFAVEPVRFAARDRNEAQSPLGDNWGKDGFYTKTFRDGEDATVTGRVVGMRTASLREGAPDARVLLVATENGEQAVVLGPEWYVKRQTLDVTDGTRVTIEGKKAKIGSREYVCAHSISADGRELTLWEQDQPMWNGR